jgi:hypothetical protein
MDRRSNPFLRFTRPIRPECTAENESGDPFQKTAVASHVAWRDENCFLTWSWPFPVVERQTGDIGAPLFTEAAKAEQRPWSVFHEVIADNPLFREE